LPIATGVTEGACRDLIKDRMDITGARWSLKGAEAVLKLRSLSGNSASWQIRTIGKRPDHAVQSWNPLSYERPKSVRTGNSRGQP